MMVDDSWDRGAIETVRSEFHDAAVLEKDNRARLKANKTHGDGPCRILISSQS